MCSPAKESSNVRNVMGGSWVFEAMHSSFTVYVAIFSKRLSVLLREKALAFAKSCMCVCVCVCVYMCVYVCVNECGVCVCLYVF